MIKLPNWTYALAGVVVVVGFMSWKIDRLQEDIRRLQATVDSANITIEDYEKTSKNNARLTLESNQKHSEIVNDLTTANQQLESKISNYQIITKQLKDKSAQVKVDYEQFKIESSNIDSCYNELVPGWLLD